jgi:nucleotide-binding universal stress UspA family protein
MDGREHVIVCGVDGSMAGDRALQWAVDEAARRGCRLRVVTAWTWDGVESMGASSSPAEAQARAQKVQEAALTRVMQTVENDSDLPELERLLLRETPSVALCTAALDAELMVLGSHGRGGVHEKLVGSTSQRAIHHASCPVVILPDPRHADRQLKHVRSRHRRVDAPYSTPMF